jgi:predicted RecA/RadA family phage recombinase
MAQNCYKGDSDTINITLAANASSGDVVVTGNRVAIVKADGLNAAIVPAFIRGIFACTKNAGEGALAVGASIHWDTNALEMTITPSATTAYAGRVAIAAADAATTVYVDINVAGRSAIVAAAAGANPTKAEYDGLLAALKAGGLMATA